MQGKRVELQGQSKKQGGSTGKGQSNLCHHSHPPLHGDSGCLGLLGGGQLLQKRRVERDFWLSAEVEQEGAIAGSWQGCVAGSKRKAPWGSQDVLMGTMSFRKRGEESSK